MDPYTSKSALSATVLSRTAEEGEAGVATQLNLTRQPHVWGLVDVDGWTLGVLSRTVEKGKARVATVPTFTCQPHVHPWLAVRCLERDGWGRYLLILDSTAHC